MKWFLVVLIAAVEVRGEATPDIQLVNFQDLFKLTKQVEKPASIGERQDRSLLNSFPFNQVASGRSAVTGSTAPRHENNISPFSFGAKQSNLGSTQSSLNSRFGQFGFGQSGGNVGAFQNAGFALQHQTETAAPPQGSLQAQRALFGSSISAVNNQAQNHFQAGGNEIGGQFGPFKIEAATSRHASIQARGNGGVSQSIQAGGIGGVRQSIQAGGIGGVRQSIQARGIGGVSQSIQARGNGGVRQSSAFNAIPAHTRTIDIGNLANFNVETLQTGFQSNQVAAHSPIAVPVVQHAAVQHAAAPTVQFTNFPKQAVARGSFAPAPRAPTREELIQRHLRINPHRARNPALVRAPGPVFEEVAVAAVEQKCVDKIEHVEEIEYDQVEECHHSYDKKCHSSFTTEYSSQQELECEENFKKECDITYSPSASNVTVRVCSRPLIKDCNLEGPQECRTEYVAECWTKDEEHTVVDDVAECQTVYDEKCHDEVNGYTSEEKCSKWPREVCSVNKKLKTKYTPQTKCEKIPQKLCGPAGCGFVEGPEQCIDKVETVVVDLPSEVCDLQPRTQCDHVTKLVPKLVPVEECVDVPKEVCNMVRGPPRKVLKPITKQWCYTPSQESGLL